MKGVWITIQSSFQMKVETLKLLPWDFLLFAIDQKNLETLPSDFSFEYFLLNETFKDKH